MIDAVVQKKAKLFFVRNQGRTPFEDCLVSAIFGSLRFMRPEDAARGAQALLDFEPTAVSIADVQVILWPERKNVESDVQISLALRGSRERVLLVEVKWDASVGDNQMNRQSRAFGPEVEQFLVVRHKNRHEAQRHVREMSVGELIQVPKVVTWLSVVRRLEALDREGEGPGALRHWASGCRSMLIEFDEREFSGFSLTSQDWGSAAKWRSHFGTFHWQSYPHIFAQRPVLKFVA